MPKFELESVVGIVYVFTDFAFSLTDHYPPLFKQSKHPLSPLLILSKFKKSVDNVFTSISSIKNLSYLHVFSIGI